MRPGHIVVVLNCEDGSKRFAAMNPNHCPSIIVYHGRYFIYQRFETAPRVSVHYTETASPGYFTDAEFSETEPT